MSIGQIVQVIGAVVDVEFPRDAMPKVYDALILEQDENNTLAEAGLTFEVQQQLGDGVVRTIGHGLVRRSAARHEGSLDRCRHLRAGRSQDPRPHHGRARPSH